MSDKLSTIHEYNANYQCVAVSSVDDIDYVKSQGRSYGGTAMLWSKSFWNDFKVLYKHESVRVTAVKLLKENNVCVWINVYFPCLQYNDEYEHIIYDFSDVI